MELDQILTIRDSKPFSVSFLKIKTEVLLTFISIGMAWVIFSLGQRMQILKNWFDDIRGIVNNPTPLSQHDLILLAHMKSSLIFAKIVQITGTFYFLASVFVLITITIGNGDQTSPSYFYILCSNLGYWFTLLPTFFITIYYILFRLLKPGFSPEEVFLLLKGRLNEVFLSYLLGKKSIT